MKKNKVIYTKTNCTENIIYEKTFFKYASNGDIADVLQYIQGDSLLSRHQGESAGGYQRSTGYYCAAQRPDFHHRVE